MECLHQLAEPYQICGNPGRATCVTKTETCCIPPVIASGIRLFRPLFASKVSILTELGLWTSSVISEGYLGTVSHVP